MGFIRYPALPDQIPMHYNLEGQVDRYAAKSMETILMMPIMLIILALVFFAIYYAILHAKNQSAGGDIEEGLKNDLAFKVIISKVVFFVGLLITLIFGISQLSMLGIIGINITFTAPIILVMIFALVTYLIVKVGQSGSRMGSSKSTQSKAVAEDDSHWILGAIYFNKDDPSIFVEKQFGMGYTINVGNKIGWMVVIAIIALIAGSLVLPLVLH